MNKNIGTKINQFPKHCFHFFLLEKYKKHFFIGSKGFGLMVEIDSSSKTGYLLPSTNEEQ